MARRVARHQRTFAGEIQRQAFRQPARRSAATNDIDQIMYEFVAESCFEYSPALQGCERLQFDLVPASCGRSPRRQTGSPDKIASRFIDEDFQSRELGANSGGGDPRDQRLAAGVEKTQQHLYFALVDSARIVDIKCFAVQSPASCPGRFAGAGNFVVLKQDCWSNDLALALPHQITRSRSGTADDSRRGKILSEDLLVIGAAFRHDVRALLAEAQAMTKPAPLKYEI